MLTLNYCRKNNYVVKARSSNYIHLRNLIILPNNNIVGNYYSKADNFEKQAHLSFSGSIYFSCFINAYNNIITDATREMGS